MWCFFDESYPPEGGVTSVFACLMEEATVRRLDQILYKARMDHYGPKHAKDLKRELKGSALLSKNTFRIKAASGYSKNHELTAQVLDECAKSDPPILVFGSAVYGASDLLKKLDGDRLMTPVRDILNKVSVAGKQLQPNGRVNLVFDEQLGAQTEIAMQIRQFVSGVKLSNVSHYPLVSVSNVSPGIQLADIGAFILGKRAAGSLNFQPWLTRLKKLEWKGLVDGRQRWGVQRYDKATDGTFQIREKWQ